MSIVDSVADRQDMPAFVRFETRAVENKAESLKVGHPVYKDVDYALVTPPYSKDLFESKVDTWFDSKEQEVRDGRLPKSHMDYWKKAYQAFLEGKEPPLEGTPVEDLTILTPAQIKTIKSAGIRTVESLAQANDEGLRRLGMGGTELKRKANKWLQTAQDSGAVVMRASNLERENEQLKQTVEDLMENVRILTQKVNSMNQPQTVEPVAPSMDMGGLGLEDNIVSRTAPDPFPTPVTPLVEEEYTPPEPALQPVAPMEERVTIQASSEDTAPHVLTPAMEYEQITGKKPDKRWKETTIVQKVKEARKAHGV